MGAPMRYQPQGLARVRREFANGRSIGFMLGPGRGDVFGSRAELAYFGSPAPAQVSNQHGLSRRFVSANSTYARATPAAGLIDLAGNFAAVVVFTVDTSDTSRVVHYSDAVNNLNFQLVVVSRKLRMVVGTGSNQFPNAQSDVLLEVGRPYVVVTGRAPNGYFMHLDGVEQLGNGGGGLANNIRSTDIILGRRSDGASYFNGQIALFAHIGGTVDAASLSANPWQIFDDMSDEAEAAAQAAILHVLSAGSGQFALTGAEANLRAARRLGTSSAGFAVAGDAAGLHVARRMSAEPGEVTLGGGGVTVRTARRLYAGAGAFSLAGGAAALIASRRLSAAAGSFAVVGQAVTLVHTAAPAPDGPTYVLTAGAGNFALTGAAVAVIAARRLAAGAGVFGTTGAPVRLLVGRRMNGGPGVLEVSGTDALLQVTRRLPAAAGSFALAGSDVVFKHSGQIKYARAPAGAGYTPRRSEYQARPVLGGHQSRPAQVSTGGRPPATQENYR